MHLRMVALIGVQFLCSCSTVPTTIPAERPSPSPESAQEASERAVPTKSQWLQRVLQKPDEDIDLVEAATVLASEYSGRAHSYSDIPRALQPAIERVRHRMRASSTDDEKIELLNEEVIPIIRHGKAKEFRWLFDSMGGQEGGCAVHVLLYWIAADTIGLKLSPVCIPLHIFLTHVSDTHRRNIETTDRGQNLTIEEYRALISRDLTHIETLPEESESLKGAIVPLTRRQYVSILLSIYDDQFKAGDEDLKAAGRLAPDFYFSWKVLGGYYASRKQFEKSEEATTNAIALAPYMPGLYGSRANCRLRLDKIAPGIQDVDEAIRLAPHYAQYHLTRGLLLHLALRNDEAITECTIAIQAAPSIAEFWRYRGLLKSQVKQYDGAISDYSKAIALDPKQAVYYERRSELWAMIGDEAKYEADRAKALELHGNH